MLKQGLQGRTERYEIQETTPPNGTTGVKAEGVCENMMEDEKGIPILSNSSFDARA